MPQFKWLQKYPPKRIPGTKLRENADKMAYIRH